MTAQSLYTIRMNTYFFLLSAQISAPVGCVFVLLLFFTCFFCTHLVKLAMLGWKSRGTPTSSPSPASESAEKEKAPAEQPEPIYYIVERKQRRAKANFSEPKEIRFK